MPKKAIQLVCEVGRKTVSSYLYFRCYFEANCPNRIYFLLKVLLIWKFIAKSIS